MADAWGGSWLSSWGGSWGSSTPTPTPEQTGGAAYWSTREIRRKKRKATLLQDIEATLSQLEQVKAEIPAEIIAEPVSVVTETVIPDQTPQLMAMYELQNRLARLQAIVGYIERQQDEEDVMILFQSLPFMGMQ